ncbi:MAG TPA: ELM1/GtrOC1 family putative glycosyltransferase [Candidatus Margulisiibacteriota bacterium]|nr:ELM1/GtrOC1 family putative glycosyltransferase [Candidatus Margulisiibacteriota bacterium]
MAAPPRVWVLLGRGVGGNGQMSSLAQALGWPYEAKHLVFNRLSFCPNLLLGAAAITLDHRRSSPLRPPWPDLVIAGSRRSAPVARWIKKQSGGATRLVHLMHAQAPLEHFDLVVTTPQYRLPTRHNVLHNIGPLNHIDPARLAAAGATWAARFAGLQRPYTALLVGGNSSSYLLDPDTAARLAREASAQVRAAGGSLLVTTSARTPPAAADVLLAAIDCPAYAYRWQANDKDNPYYAVLALADRFIVTADSASLLAEACATDKPVALFDWPLRADADRGAKGLLRRWGEARYRQGSAAAVRATDRIYDRLVYLGLIKPARDFGAYHRALRMRGLVSRPGESTQGALRQPLDDLSRAVERIHRLFIDGAAVSEPCDDLEAATAVPSGVR